MGREGGRVSTSEKTKGGLRKSGGPTAKGGKLNLIGGGGGVMEKKSACTSGGGNREITSTSA